MQKYRKFDAIIMPQVIKIKTISKGTSFFTFYFFKTYFQIAQEVLKQSVK